MSDKNKQTDIAAQRIKEDILNCVLPPDSQLKISELSKKYDLSGTPIREALNKLSISGLILIKPMRGFFVAPVSIKEMQDIYNSRLIIDTEILKLAMKNGDDAWEANIIAKLYQFNKYKESPLYDFNTWQDKIHDVHLAMMAACNSPTLQKIHTLLFNQSERYRIIWYKKIFHKDTLKASSKKQIHTEEENLLEPLTKAVIKRDEKLVSKIFQKKIIDCTSNITKKLTEIGIEY